MKNEKAECGDFWNYFEVQSDNIKIKFMNEIFGDLIYEVVQEWTDYDSEIERLKQMKEQQKFFPFNSTGIHRDDLKAIVEGKDDCSEIYAKIDKLSAEQMQRIADYTEDSMMDEQFRVSLQIAFDEIIKEVDEQC